MADAIPRQGLLSEERRGVSRGQWSWGGRIWEKKEKKEEEKWAESI